MNTKMKTRSIMSILCLLIALFVTACVDGYKDDETFSSSVTNEQLDSPDGSKVTITSVTNTTTGAQDLKITWPVVYGAGGYEFSLYNVDDPNNPVIVGIEDQIIDGCSVTRERAEDTKYKIVIKTLGNKELNNTGATQAVEIAYTTLLSSIAKIPNGSDLGEYFEQNPILNNDSIEQVYELESGGNYTINTNLDFGTRWVTLRGDKLNHPTVVMGEEGLITIMNGFKIRFIDFDCTNSAATGFVTMNSKPAEMMKIHDTNRYIVLNPIVFQSSTFKGLGKSLFYGNAQSYVIKNLQILECIVQLNNKDSDASLINCFGGSYNCIKDLMVMNSTMYNLQANSKAYFLRYANASNAQPPKLGFLDKQGSIFIANNTFCKVFTGKDFGNNLPTINSSTVTMTNNVFYDCFRVNKAVVNNTTQILKDNYLFTVTNTIDGTDKSKIGTEENPGFTGPIDLDPSAVNFTPTSSLVLGARSGDPRWLPAK